MKSIISVETRRCFLGLALGLGVAIASGYDALAQSTLETAREKGTIGIGIANAPPWSEMKSDGTIAGAEVDIATTILKKLGIPSVEPTVLDWGAMIPALTAKRVDIVAAGMTITPARCEIVLFSEPQTCGTYAFGVKKGNPLQITNYKEVAEHPTAKLAVCGGCADERWAIDAGIPRDRLVLYPDETSALKMLSDGRVDAYSQTTVTILDQLAKNPNPEIEVVHPVTGIPTVCGGTVFRKEDREFRDAWDQVLLTMKENGEFDEIVAPYHFPAGISKDVKRAELCQVAN